AVDHFRLRLRLGVLNRGFLARLGLEAGLLDLLLLQRQRVLHRVCLCLGLDHARLSLTFRLLHLADFRRLGLRFGDFHALLFDVGLDGHLIVLLLLEQQAFEPLRILLRQLHPSQQHFLYDNRVAGQPRRDGLSRVAAKLLALDREDVAHHVIRRQLAKRGRYHRFDDLFVERLRQVRLDVVELARIHSVAHRHADAHGESFARLHRQQFEFFVRGGAGRRLKNAIADVVELHAVKERPDQVRPWVQSAGPHTVELAHADRRLAIRDYYDAFAHERQNRRDQDEFDRRLPPRIPPKPARSTRWPGGTRHKTRRRKRAGRKARPSPRAERACSFLLCFSRGSAWSWRLTLAQEPVELERKVDVVQHQSRCAHQKTKRQKHQQSFQEQHDVLPSWHRRPPRRACAPTSPSIRVKPP